MAAEKILRDYSDSAILIASEESLMTYWHRTVDASSIYRGEDMLRVYTSFPHPLLNSVCCPRFGEQSAEKQVSKVIDFFRTRGVPHSWWIGASSTPERLGEILIGKGLVKGEWEQPAMAVDLRTLDYSKLQEISDRSGVVVSQVETESDLDLWMGIFSDIYTGFSIQSMDAFHSVLRIQLGEGEASDLMNFIAKIDGEPVGVSMILLGAGVAGLYNVGTLKEHERKGIGSAVSLMALLYGRKRGYEIGVLQSSAPALNVYTRLGFKEYFKWQIYFGDGGS
jgi:ribosomal protein S18 acetylase RimI-like enzyme